MPVVRILPSAANPSPISLNAVNIAGLVVAGIIVLSLVLWISSRWKHAAKRREEGIGAGSVIQDGVEHGRIPHKSNLPVSTILDSPKYAYVHPSIAVPEEAITRQSERDALREQELERIPRPFLPKPFAIAIAVTSTSSAESEGGTGRPTSSLRNSFLSTGSGQNRYSVSSSVSNTETKCNVRQLFIPVLPDELLISAPGEQLTVIQSFDDGWCLVGRENSVYATTAKSLFRENSENNIELGVVPAWCFIKPLKGLRVERPVRSSSLGITVQLQVPGISSRGEVISWSNF